MKRAAVIVSLWVAVAMTVELSAQAQTVPVGAGGQSCGQWVATRKEFPTNIDTLGMLAMESWVQGFLPRVTARIGRPISLGDPTHDARAVLDEFHIFRD